jgi:hypothetical protein
MWFVDKLAVAPYLWICGPPGSGKTTLLRLLHCLCRRPVLIAGSIPSWFYSLPALLRPTLLLDELQLSGTQHSWALECWLRAGNAHGVPVAVRGQLVDGFGAKVLCSRQPASDSALASRALHISMIPSCKNLQALDEETVQRIADDFQARLLMFRLQHYREFQPEPIDHSQFNPRIRDMVCALLLPLRGEKEFLAPLYEALEEQLRQAAIEKADEPEALVTIALFCYCHDAEFSAVLVGQIAAKVNEQVNVTGLGGFVIGPNANAPQATYQQNRQTKYAASWVKGRHTIQFGAEYNRIDEAGFASFFGLGPRVAAPFSGGVAALPFNANGASDPLNYSVNSIFLGNGLGAGSVSAFTDTIHGRSPGTLPSTAVCVITLTMVCQMRTWLVRPSSARSIRNLAVSPGMTRSVWRLRSVSLGMCQAAVRL